LLADRLQKQWRARQATAPIHPTLTFKAEGLVLGAETVLAPIEDLSRPILSSALEDRLITLLSAAYHRPVGAAVIKHLRKAADRWRQGEHGLASIHLALTRLEPLREPHGASLRLFMVDRLLEEGVDPPSILTALRIDGEGPGRVRKAYNPAEPRILAGDLGAGRWTTMGASSGAVLIADARTGLSSPPPTSLGTLGELSAAALRVLGTRAATLIAEAGGAAIGGLGLAFIPEPNNVVVQGDIKGVPGLRYHWATDTVFMTLLYRGPDGVERSTAINLDGGPIRDSKGRVVARAVKRGILVINTATLIADMIDKEKPDLCPAPEKDKPGQGDKFDARDYEDYVKHYVNPDNPTPRALAYYFNNPVRNQDPVTYDDCQHGTGALFEAKGPRYGSAGFKYEKVWDGVGKGMVNQAERQIEASQGRPIFWLFANEEGARRTQEWFKKHLKYKNVIHIQVLSWSRK
jgi:hypothetical protein